MMMSEQGINVDLSPLEQLSRKLLQGVKNPRLRLKWIVYRVTTVSPRQANVNDEWEINRRERIVGFRICRYYKLHILGKKFSIKRDYLIRKRRSPSCW